MTVLTLISLAVLAQPTLPPLSPISLTTGSALESVTLEVSADGAVTRTVKTDHPVAPLRGQLTESEHLKFSTLTKILEAGAPPTSSPPSKDKTASRLELTLGKKKVSVASRDELTVQWSAFVGLLQDLDRRLLRGTPPKRR